jgi:hypothetical protein
MADLTGALAAKARDTQSPYIVVGRANALVAKAGATQRGSKTTLRSDRESQRTGLVWSKLI